MIYAYKPPFWRSKAEVALCTARGSFVPVGDLSQSSEAMKADVLASLTPRFRRRSFTFRASSRLALALSIALASQEIKR